MRPIVSRLAAAALAAAASTCSSTPALAQSPSSRPALVRATVYCPHPRRARVAAARFRRATGYPHGRPGYVVDHVVPLCACGLDAPANMQWQTRADAARKDATEKATCRALAGAGGGR